MADNGAVVEFDFTALDGAGLLFDTAKRFLSELDGLALDVPTEARYLAGNDYQVGLARLFESVKTKKTAEKAARDLAELFNAELTDCLAAALTPGFRNFVRTLASAGLKVVVSTRADICADRVREAFGDLLDGNVVLYQETSMVYGSQKWDAWRRACARNRLRNTSTVAVTGSGFGVKAALLADMGTLAVIDDHVAYQDFGGADEIVEALDTAAAKKVLSILKIK